ncbi:MAG: peptidoglycan editing factor PgeF [Caldilineaceae bacterium]|nr:peptidoglycan editing factor PgeF [Caldilineaceae bacterium]
MHRVTHPNGVVTYTFDLLADYPVLVHVSTRHGGVSPAPWNTLNFSVARGDTRERVEENRRRFAEAAGINPAHVTHARQVHGTGVAKVDWEQVGETLDGIDALVTDAVGLPLSTVFADCVPILLYDPSAHALGICHAGWRGTVNGAAVAMLWAMQAAYGSDPAQMIACIGPSIGPESYQVGEEVLAMAQAKLPNADQYFHFPDGEAARPHFDLWQANVGQLVEAGVLPEQIEVSGIDTAQHTDDFYSHRAEQGRCGLFAMMAWLSPKP